MKFTTDIVSGGGNTTGIVVPPEIVEGLGAGKKPAVKVTFNNHTYPSTIATMGGDFMISVSAAIREATGAKAGDTVEVELVLDTEPRVVDLPEDFASALNAEPDAKSFFATLSNSNKKRIVLPIGDAKTAETRQRRIEKSIENLKVGKI